MAHKKIKKETGNPYETILALVVVLIGLFYIFDWKWAPYVALGLGLSSLIIKPLARLVHRLWTKLTHAVGFVMTHVLLSGVFFLILTPMAFLYRLFNKDKLMNKKGKDSYFHVRDHAYEKKDLKNTW